MTKPQVNIPEELVEEIRAEALKHTIVVLNRETILAIIARICRAFLDGELDDYFGVVGRWKLRAYNDMDRLFLAGDAGDGSLPGCYHYDPPIIPGEILEFIALRPEKGGDVE